MRRRTPRSIIDAGSSGRLRKAGGPAWFANFCRFARERIRSTMDELQMDADKALPLHATMCTDLAAILARDIHAELDLESRACTLDSSDEGWPQ